MKEIVERLGVPALLEQTAEECAELNQACLKLSRKIRGENPTPKHTRELKDNLCEEIADVLLCVDTIIASDDVDVELINMYYKFKYNRWKNRLNINEKGE